MKLPKNEIQRDRILHDNPSANQGYRDGNKMAELYHATRSHISFANVLATADSFAFADYRNRSYKEAFCLQFVIRYMKLEGYEMPFATAEPLVTSDQSTKGNDGMLNKIMLIGNLGRDPELNVTGDGTPVTKFSLAVSRQYKTQSGEKREETEWFNIVMWRKLAEIAEQWLSKGSKVYIEGRLNQRKYTDRDGIQRTSVEVTAEQMEMLGDAKRGNGNGDDRPVSDDPFLPDFPDEVEEQPKATQARSKARS